MTRGAALARLRLAVQRGEQVQYYFAAFGATKLARRALRVVDQCV
jgi:hypothetical protein